MGKQTVYRHFGSKEVLFEGLLGGMCGGVFALPTLDASGDLPGTLREVGRGFVRVVTDPANLALFRIVVAEAERFPCLAQRFHAGVAAAVAYVAGLLAREGAVSPARAEELAATFLEMVKGPAFLRLLLGAPALAWNDNFEPQVERAVAIVVGQVRQPRA